MNKRQLETEKAKLADEKKVLDALKRQYKQAAQDAAEKISFHQGKIDKIEILLKDLDGADDDVRSLLQSQIYQKQYQEALKKQIDAIVDNMNQKQYKTVADYLKGCYETGFLASMYDLHGQGIPIITPIDQKAMVRAVTLDSKVSKKLYGTYTDELKKRIQAEVSRGIATNQQYATIARNLNIQTNIGLNKAMRIARTEGHGVQIQAAVEAQYKAREAGADILKQWNSVLDGKTRPEHRKLDGELRELDETFSNGMKYPSDPAGGAAEVINCRCALMQRARKAMDEEELHRLKDRAAYYGLDKTENFENFKKKYLKAAESVENEKAVAKAAQKVYKESGKLDISSFSPAFTTKSEAKNTQKLVDYVNNLEGASPAALKLYNSIGKLEKFEANGIKFSISHGKNHAVQQSYNGITGKIAEVKLIIPKLSGDNLAGQVNTTLHEQMHLLDLMLKDDITKHGAFFTASNEKFKKVFKATDDTIGEAVGKMFEDFKKEYDAIKIKYQDLYKEEHAKILDQYMPNGAWAAGADYKGYKKAASKLKSDIEAAQNYDCRNIMGGGINELQDIYDALSGGKYRDTGVVKYGHGSKYYRSIDSRLDEIIANYASLSVTSPELIEILQEDKPELVAALDELIEEMGKKVDDIDG